MRQPAGVMARGFWLIELLPALHTEQDPRMEDKSGGTLAFSSLLVNVWLRQKSQMEEGREKDRQTQTLPEYLSVTTVTFRHSKQM